MKVKLRTEEVGVVVVSLSEPEVGELVNLIENLSWYDYAKDNGGSQLPCELHDTLFNVSRKLRKVTK